MSDNPRKEPCGESKPASGGCPQDQALPPRESEILALQSAGLSYKAIADRLQISVHTVSNHLYTIHQKLGVHSGIEAINRIRRR